MPSQVRYQVFLSSTYEDLREERQQATQAILEAGCFPSGMELFPASNDTQWDLIKRVIEESDYYVVIVAGRYGSLGPKDISYTEMEYDYASKKRIPIPGFISADLGKTPLDRAEKNDDGRMRLEAFRKKVMSRTCVKYSSSAELGMAVLKSLVSESRVRPRVGWVRSDQARSDDDLQRERKLVEELGSAEIIIQELERKLRDKDVLGEEIPRDLLAQGDDEFEFVISFQDNEKKAVSARASLSWDNIFKIIGPSMYGYMLRKTAPYNGKARYQFEDNLEDALRERFIDRVQSRAIRIQQGQIDMVVFQLKELGLIEYAEKIDKDGDAFRGVTLTRRGEKHLTLLSTTRKDLPGIRVGTVAVCKSDEDPPAASKRLSENKRRMHALNHAKS